MFYSYYSWCALCAPKRSAVLFTAPQSSLVFNAGQRSAIQLSDELRYIPHSNVWPNLEYFSLNLIWIWNIKDKNFEKLFEYAINWLANGLAIIRVIRFIRVIRVNDFIIDQTFRS